MRFSKAHISKFSALVLALLALTVFVARPSATASAAGGPVAFVACPNPPCACFPSCDETDGRMLSLSGGGLSTFVGGKIEIGFTKPAGLIPNTTSIGVFDPDSRGPLAGGLWDDPTMELKFEIFADPNNDGTGATLAFGPFFSTQAAAVAADNNWWEQTFPNLPAAQSAPGQPYFYFLRITPNTPNPDDGSINGIKVRTDGTFALTGQTIQFIAKANRLEEFAVIGGVDTNTGACPTATTYDGTWEFEFEVKPGTMSLELWDGDFDFGNVDPADAANKDTDDPNSPASVPAFAAGTSAHPEGIASDGNGPGVGAPPDDVPLCAFRRSPGVVYEFLPPGAAPGTGYKNANPSGSSEWERFLISLNPADNPDVTPATIPAGKWKLRIEGMDVFNQFALHFNKALAPEACPICTQPEIVVDKPITLDAKNLAATAGVLAGFATFAGDTITIDLKNQPLHVTKTGSISVLAGANLQPAQFHQSGNHGTPNLTIKSSCTLLIDESVRGTLNALFRSLTGVIETNALGGKAGDILLAFDGLITINGGVQSFQEKLPDSASSLSGAITIQNVCGEIRVGPKGWVVTWGENPGTKPISLIQLGTDDILVNGLVMNRTNHTIGSNPPPIINVHAVGGAVKIDGSQLVLDEFNLMGTKYDLTSGLLTISRVSADVGKINIQASKDVTVFRNQLVGFLNRTSFAAVATAVNSNSPIGGTILVRSLNGGIFAQGRAFQADGRGDNSAALIELIANGLVQMQTPPVLNSENTPTVTTSAATVNGVGKAGKNVLQSCTGAVDVQAGAAVLASGVSGTGINQSSAPVVVAGTVNPAFVGVAPVCPPTPLF